ncbi:MAG: LPS assembly lipoprotein LptE [Planctomycetota bacterium]|nr:LPS assembly lipoprotein LptE [Planctomycetota bacterium]
MFLVAITTLGCGYQSSIYSPQVATIAVPIFENKTTWREMEFDLTSLVHREIKARTPFRLVSRPEDADIVILGEIVSCRRPSILEDTADNVVIYGSVMTLNISIKDQKTGKSLITRPNTIENEFIRGASETVSEAEYRARAQTYEQLARWVISLLEELR